MRSFKNYQRLIKAINKRDLKGRLEFLNSMETVEQLCRRFEVTKAKKRKFENDLKGLKAYMSERIKVKFQKRLQDAISDIEYVGKLYAPIESLTISVEWKTNRTWGANPICGINCISTQRHHENNSSSSISGAGYCRLSTSTAEALNKSKIVTFTMLDHANRLLGNASTYNLIIESDNPRYTERLFSYGANIGWSLLPEFKGGVGISSHDGVFKELGYKFNYTASGKMYDVYTVNK